MSRNSEGSRGVSVAETATQAWMTLYPDSNLPRSVQIFKDKRKSVVVRLEGVGEECVSVIAKWASSWHLIKERTIYEEILPQLAIPRLDYYGALQRPEQDSGWIFLGDAGDVAFSSRDSLHRRLAAQWLATLHTAAADLPQVKTFMDTGPKYYLNLLFQAQVNVRKSLQNTSWDRSAGLLIRKILDQLAVIASHEDDIVIFSRKIPRTLVHGDFSKTNVRVKQVGEEMDLLVFDWEHAGRAMPAADLEKVDLESYFFAVRKRWTSLDRSTVQFLALLGRLFRCIAGIKWTSHDLKHEWRDRPLRRFGLYEGRLAEIILALGW